VNVKKGWDVAIIGGGVVGLGIASAWINRNPRDRVIIFEKETTVGSHSSGRNSGILHAGFYYTPDSLKARLTRKGNAQMRSFCIEHNVAIRESGKVVVTRSPSEISALEELFRRGIANGCELELIDENQLRELEPYATTCGRALWSPLTAVADPVQVTEAMAKSVADRGVSISLGANVIFAKDGELSLESGERYTYGHLINAAGLYADKVAHWFEVGLEYEIIPFKGLYLYDASDSVKLRRQVYPVPNPKNPFLGVHVTVTVNGRVKIGPTAIPALKREDYGNLLDLDSAELKEILSLYPRFLASRHHNVLGLISSEIPKYSKKYLARQARRLVPALKQGKFIERGRPGVRAQLLNKKTKQLEMDFVVRPGLNSTHMLNVVSPAWTSSIAVGEYTVDAIHSDGLYF
jgi:L-2-hydroxyglutarate oxidase LhgO